MKKYYGRAVISALLLVAVFAVLRIPRDVYRQMVPVTPVPPAAGLKDDPAARTAYEWKRLRDPSTNRIPAGIRRRELAFAERIYRETSQESPEMLSRKKQAGIQTSNWTWRGPVNIGGRTRALAVDAAAENVLLAGGVSGGMWRSTDVGLNWIKTTAISDLHSVTSLIQDTRPDKRHIWYYSTGEITGNSASGGSSDAGSAAYRGDGIYSSADSGKSWSLLESTATHSPEYFDQPFDYIFNMVIDTSNSVEDELYAATIGSIRKSTDGGVTWTAVLGTEHIEDFSARFTDVVIDGDGILYATLSNFDISATNAGIDKGIWISADGDTWTKIDPLFMPPFWRRIVIGIAPSNSNIVYFLGETPGTGLNQHSFWRFDRSDSTWSNRSDHLPDNDEDSQGGRYASQGSYDMLVKVHPNDKNVVFIGGVNLYRSTDGFASSNNTTWIGGWLYEDEYNQHADQHALVFLPSDPDVMFSGHDGGVTRTGGNMADDVVWTTLNNGYNTTQYYTVGIDHGTPGSVDIIGGMQDNGTWYTDSASPVDSWVELPPGGDGAFCSIQDGGSTVIVSAQYGYMIRQAENGGTVEWQRIDPLGANGYIFINPFVVNPFNSLQVYLPAGSELWRCDNVGLIPVHSNDPASSDLWTQLTFASLDPPGAITAVEVTNTMPNRLYYGTDDGRLYKIDAANIGDPVPVDIWSNKNLPADAYVSCIAVDPSNENSAIVVFSNYTIPSLYYTDDGGSSWAEIGGNLEETRPGFPVGESGPSLRWAEIVPADGETVYFLGTSTGLYSTLELDGENTLWVPEGENTIGNMVVDMVTARASDGYIAVGTHGGGVYSSTVVTAVEPDDHAAPEKFSLGQNYPNPFNPETTITFSIPRAGNVKVTVYSVLGEEVKTIVNSEINAGPHTVRWDGTNSRGQPVSSGVYIYRIDAGEYSSSKKMLLLR
ncbi:FlgD immunoglobulin-like domain containing protein [candidate division KSB1 bacterium]